MGHKGARSRENVFRNANAAEDSDDSSGLSDDDYVVESILNKRINQHNLGVEYLIKWRGYGDGSNTWEPVGNLKCPELVKMFEEKWSRVNDKKKLSRKPTSSSSSPSPVSKGTKKKIKGQGHDHQKQSVTTEFVNTTPKLALNAFDRGLEPEEIIGATDAIDDQLHFLMKWKGTHVSELVPAKVANVKCPEVVIRYYEGLIVFHDNKK